MIALFAFLLFWCCSQSGMNKAIHLENTSNRNFEVCNESRSYKLLKNSYQLIPLAWNKNGIENTISLEFYDVDDKFYSSLKKLRMCTYILYFHRYKIGKQKNYQLTFEKKRPRVETIYKDTYDFLDDQKLTLLIEDASVWVKYKS